MKKLVIACMLAFAYAEEGASEDAANTAGEVKQTKQRHTQTNPAFVAQNGVFENLNLGSLGLSYINVLSFSDSEILNLNGFGIHYEYLLSLQKLQLKSRLDTSLGYALASRDSSNENSKSFLTSVMLGLETNLPLWPSPLSYFVGGLEVGFSIPTSSSGKAGLSSLLSRGFVGLDFLYKSVAFRPFLRLAYYRIYGEGPNQRNGVYGDLGLTTTFYFTKIAASFEAVVRQDFMRDTSGLVVLLPDLNALLLSNTATSLNGKLWLEVSSSQWLRFRAEASVAYNLMRYNLSTFVGLRALIDL